MHNRSSSHRQQDAARSLQPSERLLPRDPQLPDFPSSPRLRGGDTTQEATGSAYVLPAPDSCYPHIIPVNQQQRRQHSDSDTGHAHAQQGCSRGLPFVDQQHHQQQQHFQPWSGHAQSTPVQSGAAYHEVQHLQQQHWSPNPYAQVPRLVMNPSPEAKPPLPSGPPSAAAVSAPHHTQQAAAATGKGDDSSDSSSSQLASSRRDSTRVLPGILDSGRIGKTGRLGANTSVVRDTDNLQRYDVVSPQEAGHAAGLWHTMTKQQAADAVKALIKPLYVAKALSKDQFKAVAQTCTHTLAAANGHSGDNIGVRKTVCDCLIRMNLNEAAAHL